MTRVVGHAHVGFALASLVTLGLAVLLGTSAACDTPEVGRRADQAMIGLFVAVALAVIAMSATAVGARERGGGA